MRTEEDLRDAFDHLADAAPDASHILATAPDLVRRRRTPLLVAAALATTAAVVAVPLVVRESPPAQPAARPGDEAWRDRLSLALPAGLIYDSRAFGHTSQGIILDGGTSRTTCVANAYARGAFDSGRIPPGSPRIDVNGHSGYVARLADPLNTAVSAKSVVWESAPDTWTTSYCKVAGKVDPSKAAVVARLVNTSPQRLPAPYRIGYLPGGLTVGSLSVNPQGASTSEAPNNFIAYLGDQASGRPESISYLTGRSAKATKLPTNAERITVNGRTAYLGKDGVLAIVGNGFQVRIELSGAGSDELIKIARGLDLAPSATDLSTWFDAATAIP